MTAADEKRDPRYRGQAVNRLIPDIYIMEMPYSDYTPAGFSVLLGTSAGFLQIESIEIRVLDKLSG